ncbi:MAG: chromosome segregation protein SMC, partial [Bdellovibrionales bacterium]
MRIKKLELCGFKSFKDRTVIHFDAGITGIVGPNGCGKSNIVDALVWVMGEMSAKHLRGANMADVIFAGADGYAPVGMAEVSLTLENDGGPFPAKYSKFSEIMVTRRLYRSGDSEYLVNKEVARLRDIQEIFMDTGAGSKGFSIVEQGAIGKIITAKPEDRRTLIEEAAGITKFKVRKRESQRKLESTEQNLIRLQDIIGEQKRHLDSLQRQAQRAERYRNLKKEAQDKELWVSAKSYLTMNTEAKAAAEIFNTAQGEELQASANLSNEETELQGLKLSVLEREKLVEEWQTKHQERRDSAQRLEREVRELQFEIEQARRTEEMTGSIKNQYEARKQALDIEKDKYSLQLTTTDALAQELKGKYEARRAELDAIQARIRQVDEDLTVKRREMLTVSQSESHISARTMSLEEKAHEIEARLETARAVYADLGTQKEEFEKRRNRLFSQLEGERQMQLDIVKDVETYQSNMELLHTQVQSRQGEVEHFKDELNKVSSRLYGLENLQANFEGFEDGVKNVMLWQRSRQVVRADGSVESESEFQPVAEVIEVPAEYELAMEAALGNRLQLLLSKSSDAALGAVDYLKEQKNGRSSFVAADWNPNRDVLAESRERMKQEMGVQGLLEDIAQIPENFAAQVKPFLSGVAIVDSIRTALRLRGSGYEGFTYVTKDGDTLTHEGVLTGGDAGQAESGVLKRRREIKELSRLREEWAGKLALAQASLKKMQAQLESLTTELEGAKRRQSEKELMIVGLKKDLERAETELSNAQRAYEKQSHDVSRDEAGALAVRNDLDQLNERLIELRTQKLELENSVAALTAEYEQSRGGVDELSREVSALQVDSTSKLKEAEGLRFQLEMVEKSLLEVNEQIAKMSEESQKNTESLSTNQVTIEHRKVEFERVVR